MNAPRLVVTAPDAFADAAADFICEWLRANSADALGAVGLGLASGDTYSAVYRELAVRAGRGEIDFAGRTMLLLDEYVGLPAAHPQTFRNSVRRQFGASIAGAALHAPDGNAADLPAECARYERLVMQNRVGLQLLGIGANAHIGFNEPDTAFASRTRIAALTAQTRAANARFFAAPDVVPHTAITQGIATILAARELLLLACGPGKSHALHAALQPPTPQVPASALQLHANATIIADESAAALLSPFAM